MPFRLTHLNLILGLTKSFFLILVFFSYNNPPAAKFMDRSMGLRESRALPLPWPWRGVLPLRAPLLGVAPIPCLGAPWRPAGASASTAEAATATDCAAVRDTGFPGSGVSSMPFSARSCLLLPCATASRTLPRWMACAWSCAASTCSRSDSICCITSVSRTTDNALRSCSSPSSFSCFSCFGTASFL